MDHKNGIENEIADVSLEDETPSRPSSATAKRTTYRSFKDTFMGIAVLLSERSKDPVTQVGACIVDKDKKIIATGYNGMPRGCSDDEFPWGKESEDPLENKHLYVCHAEMNAIVNRKANSVEGCTIYVTLFPCHECAKLIIQSGIKEVVYLRNTKKTKPSVAAAEKMLEEANVFCKKFEPDENKITISFMDD